MTDADLAAIALAAYTEPATITGLGPFRGTHGIFRAVGEERIVAFRGTDDPGDWFLDFMSSPMLTYRPGGSLIIAHQGFVMAATTVYGAVKELKPTILTGHSLGAAIALIIAARLIGDGLAPKTVVTFGSPKVGFYTFSRIFGEDIQVRQYRRGNDPVTTVPIAILLFPYRHVRLPLIEIGKVDDNNPFSCHHMAGYAEDILTAGQQING